MRRKTIDKLGELERAVMEQVWAAAESGQPQVSVREVHSALAATRELAYTTVMTVMTRLADSGLLRQERSGRAYHYAASGSRQELTAVTMLEQLQGLSSPDRKAALLHFLDDASSAEIADLKSALSEIEQRQSGRGGSAEQVDQGGDG